MTPKPRLLTALVLLSLLLTACAAASTPAPTLAPIPTDTPQPSPTTPPTATLEPTATATPTLEPTPAYPPEGLGPANFPAEVDPLTGLVPADPALLNRRPIIVKVQNLPRDDRPQFGVSKADIVYEYYTEWGTTRFAAVYYGQDADQVGPVRSGRYFDANLIRAYKANFIFGSADPRVYQAFADTEFGSRLVLEGGASSASGTLSRYDPSGKNYLMVNTARLKTYLAGVKMDDSRQNLDGMFFQLEAPQGGSDIRSFVVRFSSAIYNRWDYDPASGRYLRFSDTQNADAGPEVFAQLTDRSTGQPIAADNVAVIFVLHQDREADPNVEMLDMNLLGQGDAYLARDGQMYKLLWQRLTNNDVLTLLNPDGTPFPFKPGQTWFEIIDLYSTVKTEGNSMRFDFVASW